MHPSLPVSSNPTSASTPVLQALGAVVDYGERTILQGLELAVHAGEIYALLGANGAGKTTTLRAICRHLVDTRGEVRLAGERIDRHSTERIARQGVGHVPDGRGTFAQLSAEDNLRLGAQARPTRAARADVGGDMERMFGYFPRLRERRTQQAGTLSGGEQQMLAIARALMGRPRLLLLDEPSFGLAPLVVRDIFGILRRINAEQGTTILLVEQNARAALEVADHGYVLEMGSVSLEGEAKQLAVDSRVIDTYLGAARKAA